MYVCVRKLLVYAAAVYFGAFAYIILRDKLGPHETYDTCINCTYSWPCAVVVILLIAVVYGIMSSNACCPVRTFNSILNRT